jgi:hypothetical protein
VVLPFDVLNIAAVVPDDQRVVIHLVCQGFELQFLFLRVGRERDIYFYVRVYMYIYIRVEWRDVG